MTDAPPYVAVADRLIQRVAEAASAPELDALWRDASFRAGFVSLPDRARKQVTAAGKERRSYFALGAG